MIVVSDAVMKSDREQSLSPSSSPCGDTCHNNTRPQEASAGAAPSPNNPPVLLVHVCCEHACVCICVHLRAHVCMCACVECVHTCVCAYVSKCIHVCVCGSAHPVMCIGFAHSSCNPDARWFSLHGVLLSPSHSCTPLLLSCLVSPSSATTVLSSESIPLSFSNCDVNEITQNVTDCLHLDSFFPLSTTFWRSPLGRCLGR